MTFNNNTPSNFFDVLANGRSSSSPFVDIFKPRDPTTSDITSETSINNYAIQQKWLNTATNTLWELKNYVGANGILTANWIKIGGSNIVETLTGNSGGAVGPDASNNINVVGDGVYITTVGTPINNTLTIEPAGGLTTLYTENTGTATPMAGNLNVLGTAPITTTGSGSTITIASNGTIATSYVEDSGTAIPVLGVLNILGGTGITTSGSGNTVTISGSGTVSFNYTNVNHAMSPYTVLAADEYISVDCSAGTVQLNFFNSPTFKRVWVIKDRTGNAAVNNITITTPGGTVTFDGLTTYTMNSNYQAIQLLANATPTYEVF